MLKMNFINLHSCKNPQNNVLMQKVSFLLCQVPYIHIEQTSELIIMPCKHSVFLFAGDTGSTTSTGHK